MDVFDSDCRICFTDSNGVRLRYDDHVKGYGQSGLFLEAGWFLMDRICDSIPERHLLPPLPCMADFVFDGGFLTKVATADCPAHLPLFVSGAGLCGFRLGMVVFRILGVSGDMFLHLFNIRNGPPSRGFVFEIVCPDGMVSVIETGEI